LLSWSEVCPPGSLPSSHCIITSNIGWTQYSGIIYIMHIPISIYLLNYMHNIQVSVNDINSFMTILIIIIFSFESNQINLDLLSNDAKFLQISEICCIASVLNEFKMGHWHIPISIYLLNYMHNIQI
jgi:hypothetical protein